MARSGRKVRAKTKTTQIANKKATTTSRTMKQRNHTNNNNNRNLEKSPRKAGNFRRNLLSDSDAKQLTQH